RDRTLPPLPDLFVIDKLELASDDRLPSGLWFVCAKPSDLRLVLRTRLPIEADFVRSGTYDHVRVEVTVLRQDVRTIDAIRNAPSFDFHDVTWRGDREDDVLLMPVIMGEEATMLAKAFRPGPPAIVRIDIQETGTEMRGNADGTAVADFARHCADHPEPPLGTAPPIPRSK